MSIPNRKVILLLIAITALFILIAIPVVLFPFKNGTQKITENIKSEALIYKNDIPQETINKDLLVLNNKSKSEKERYLALVNIFFYFDNAYFNLGKPEIRKFTFILDKYASKNFKNEYKKEDLSTACADSECGEKTPPEIEDVMDEVRSMAIDDDWKKSIIFNLRVGSQIPYTEFFNKQDKMISYGLAVNNLITLDNPQASASAKKLKAYIKKTYNKDL